MWMPGRDRPDAERPAQAVVADLARGTDRVDAARRAREPRVEHHAVADLEALGFGTERDDVGDDLVPEHLRQREERLHRVVGRLHLAPVHEHLLGVGAADAGEAGLGDDPVGQQEAGIVHVDELHRRVREPDEEVVAQRMLSVSGSGTGSGRTP